MSHRNHQNSFESAAIDEWLRLNQSTHQIVIVATVLDRIFARSHQIDDMREAALKIKALNALPANQAVQ